MAGMGFRETGLPVQRLYAHLLHESAHAASADLTALVPQFVSHAPGPCVGALQVYLVDEAHQFPVLIAREHRDIVDARPGEIEYFALCRQRQGMLPGDHFFALDPSMRPSATAKKSFSMASCPIFA